MTGNAGHLPTKEELDEIKNVPDASKLEKPETYLLVVRHMPCLIPRSVNHNVRCRCRVYRT